MTKPLDRYPIKSNSLWRSSEASGILGKFFNEQVRDGIFSSYLALRVHAAGRTTNPVRGLRMLAAAELEAGAETPLIPYQYEGSRKESVSIGLARIMQNTGELFGEVFVVEVNGETRTKNDLPFTDDQVDTLVREVQELSDVGLLI